MTTLPGGTTPFDSTGFAPVTSTSVVLAVRTTPAPSTAPAQIRTPSTTIAREPMNASSSTITGAACGGPRTTAVPTPPQEHARGREVPLGRHLVEDLELARRERRAHVHAEVEQDRLLEPGVRLPRPAGARRRPAHTPRASGERRH